MWLTWQVLARLHDFIEYRLLYRLAKSHVFSRSRDTSVGPVTDFFERRRYIGHVTQHSQWLPVSILPLWFGLAVFRGGSQAAGW